MPSILISVARPPSTSTTSNPLPQLLQTPHGLAIIEIQGTLNMPALESGSGSKQIGKLAFPNLEHDDAASEVEGAWMKKVHLYVGQNQRLVGEVKKLAKPYGVLRRREGDDEGKGGCLEELEIVDVVRWKVFFGARPEFV